MTTVMIVDLVAATLSVTFAAVMVVSYVRLVRSRELRRRLGVR